MTFKILILFDIIGRSEGLESVEKQYVIIENDIKQSIMNKVQSY